MSLRVLLFFVAIHEASRSFYELLGVSKTAPARSIKRAFRKLALTSHPDKICAGDDEECHKKANQEFTQLRRAYEVLSDDSSRRLYDVTGRDPEDKSPPPRGPRGGGFPFNFGFHHFHSHFSSRFNRPRKPRLSRAQKMAQDRVLEFRSIRSLKEHVYYTPEWQYKECHISGGGDLLINEMSIIDAQLWCEENEECQGFTQLKGNGERDFDKPQTVWLKSKWDCTEVEGSEFWSWKKPAQEKILEKHLLLALYEADCAEQLNYDVKYPYPFAGWQNHDTADGMWWDDHVVSARMRLKRYGPTFGVSAAKRNCPTMIYIKKGATLGDFKVFTPPDGKLNEHTWTDWMWDNLEVKISVTNTWHKPVQFLWMHGNRGQVQATIQPTENVQTNTALSHEFWIRDADVQGKILSVDSNIKIIKVRSLDPLENVYSVEDRCFDQHGECTRWKNKGECTKTPDYMLHNCRIACGTCEGWPNPWRGGLPDHLIEQERRQKEREERKQKREL